jgi:pectate lyase
MLTIAAPVRGEDDRDPARGGGDVPVGWASVEGGTRGGRGGSAVIVTDAASFVEQARGEEPRTLRVSGTIRLADRVRVGSNKTIIGVGSDATIRGGGLTLFGVRNVIIRNLTITDAPDAINIEKGSHHVWIDHCDLSRCRDGLIDIKRGSDLITVSWNHFHDHGKTCLLGHSDKDEIRRMDRGHLRVTYHHNFFDGTKTRHPRVRFAEPVHVFNNYYRDNDYGIASLMDAGTLVEGNTSRTSATPRIRSSEIRRIRAVWWTAQPLRQERRAAGARDRGGTRSRL